ncbi:precorrin-6y C5,15-methyltransferase (decarboxylating) subunit CbiE [Deferribacteraceae bacterium V6Fe1]|nr:precorrin-6y C5,15-methyltransferase (decarboxylating) subunit CbiE [Deferribacteraceae bacterium V6Fe1]
MNKNIYIISAGCGNKDYLTVKALKTAEKVDFLIGAERFKNLFSENRYVVLKNTVKDAIEILSNEQSRIIGVVVSGDAGFFSLSKLLYARFKERIIEVIPGISSIQLGMARLFKSYDNVEFLSFHGKEIPFEEFEKKLEFCLHYNKNLYIISDYNHKIFDFLPKLNNILANFQIYILNNLGLPDESIYKIESLQDINKLILSLYAIYLEVKS